MKTFVEWMTDTDPTNGSDAKHPALGWHAVMTGGVSQNRLGMSFYLNPSKTGYRTVVERSESLHQDSWETIWDSAADPLMESDLIYDLSPEGAGWMSVRSPYLPDTREFLRLRYEKR